MGRITKYDTYAVEGFLCDESFQNWVLFPDESSESFWKNWLKENPGKEATIAQAVRILRTISFREEFPTTEKIAAALEKHLQAIDKIKEAKKERRFKIRRRLRAAAVISGFLILGYGAYKYWQTQAKIVISTGYGQVKTFYLPDSTRITLNAHSALKYPRFWQKSKMREVWLEGQGYFHVTHLNGRSGDSKDTHFEVHTNNGLTVQVLGTVFDVRSYGTEVSVMLKEGKIRINFNDAPKQDILMHPGEVIEYNHPQNRLVRSTTDPDTYTAWTDKKIILDGASVKKIAERLHEFYGLTVRIADTAIANKNMEGVLMLDSLPDVLFAISTSLNIQIEQNRDTLIFKPNN